MDGRSITSKYEFSESDTESMRSGQGQIAQPVSWPRRTVSLKRDGRLAGGKVVQTAASEDFLRRKSHGSLLAVPPPRTSYMFSLGDENDGLVEIIPEGLECYDEYGAQHDSILEITPATPICQIDAESPMTDEGVSYGQWRCSTSLPASRNHTVRPVTYASSIYSQDDRGSNYFDYASSIHSRESDEDSETRNLIPGQLHLRTRSLLSLAKKYSSDDDVSIYSRYCCGEVTSFECGEELASLDDDCSVYSRDEMAVPIQRLPSTRARTMDRTVNRSTPSESSWRWKPLPPLPREQDRQTWQSPVSQASLVAPGSLDDQGRNAMAKTRWSADSSLLPRPLNLVKRSASKSSEGSVSSCSQSSTPRHRPSSRSWLSVDTATSDRESSNGDRKKSDSSIFHGQHCLRIPSMRRGSEGSDPESEEQFASSPVSPPPRYSGIFRGETVESTRDENPSLATRRLPKTGRKVAKQDLLYLPPLQLPKLPDGQRILFYSRCGHLETSLEFTGDGPELPGWCPQCLKGKSRKRRVVKKELKSILKSIAE